MAKTDREQKPTWVRFSGIGVQFAGIVGVLTWLGWKFDSRYESRPWGVIVGASLGLTVGMYVLIKDSLAASKDAEEESPWHKTDDGGKRHES